MVSGRTKSLKGAAVFVASFVSILALLGSGGACDSTLNLGSVDGGTNAAPLTCADTCTRLIDTCKLATVDQRSTCLSQCAATARPSDLDCVAHTSCLAIINLCGNGNSLTPSDAGDAFAIYEISICQNGCDIALQNRCASASEHTECRDLCASMSSARRNAYAACAESASNDCSRQFDCLAELAKD